MTFMGFSLTCGLFCALIIINNAGELSAAGMQKFRYYSGNNENFHAVSVPLVVGTKHKEELALIGSIYAFTVVELILAMWSVALCFINDHQAPLTNEPVS